MSIFNYLLPLKLSCSFKFFQLSPVMTMQLQYLPAHAAKRLIKIKIHISEPCTTAETMHLFKIQMTITTSHHSAAAAEEQIKDVTNTSVVKCNARDLLNKMRWSAGTAW